jgi:haloalkane dehalogenase
MHVALTPMECFEGLPDFPFEPRFVTVNDPVCGPMRMHYVAEGDPEAPVILLLHGEPTWSYLYRHMISALSDQYRVIAPDLIGFGKSDKLTDRSLYTYARHISWLRQGLDALKLENITLFCQDWGGLIGLRLVAERPERFARVIAANTFLPTGDHPPGEAFLNWREFAQTSENFRISSIVNSGCVHPLPADVRKAYDAPFPEESLKAGARMFPLLVPIQPDDPEALNNREAWQDLRQWKKPFLTAFSDTDPITRGGDRVFQKLIPGCQGMPHVTVANAGHFLQEDNPKQLVGIIREFMGISTQH